jgi:hypothetical protein
MIEERIFAALLGAIIVAFLGGFLFGKHIVKGAK